MPCRASTEHSTCGGGSGSRQRMGAHRWDRRKPAASSALACGVWPLQKQQQTAAKVEIDYHTRRCSLVVDAGTLSIQCAIQRAL